MDVLIKGILALFWLAVIPAACGALFFKKSETFSPARSFLFGCLFLFSLSELLILLFMYFNRPLHELVVCYGVLSATAALAGVIVLCRRKVSVLPRLQAVRGTSLYFWAAVVFILFQIGVLILFAHLDADDALYVGAAATAIETDSIYRINAYTGIAYVRLPRRYILSPFPIFLAIVSQLSGGLHPAIMAHTIFPAVFLPASYAAQYQICRKWFPDNKTARGVYLLTAALLCWFSAYSVYNSGSFQMIRIWQGKALLAAMVLPLIFYLSWTIVMKKQAEHMWPLYAMANLSACLLSSMGIILAPLMMGLFSVLGAVRLRSIKTAAYGLLCCMPSIILGASYILIMVFRKWGIL